MVAQERAIGCFDSLEVKAEGLGPTLSPDAAAWALQGLYNAPHEDRFVEQP